jgi:DNA replication protein DnaC
MTTDLISPDLRATLRRLKLGRLLDTLPERLVLARQQKMPHQDFLLLLLNDEISRRDSLGVAVRVQQARLDPAMHLEAWDPTARVTFDRTLLNELSSLRFLDAHAHVAIVGPVGVGKTFLAHALAHIACRRGAKVLAVRTDQLLKTLKHARLDNSYEAELRRVIAVDLLLLDDFAIDTLDAVESRDLYEILIERYRVGSIIVTSNRGPDEWLATFADPVRAQSAIDRFTSNAYDLIIEGESYRPRLKPRVAKDRPLKAPPWTCRSRGPPTARGPLEISRGREIPTCPPRIMMKRLDTERSSEAR